jgi:hypothetical protein
MYNHTDFTQDLLGLISCYHPKAKTLNPEGRKLKLANNWAIPPRLRQAIESTFLTTTELFGSLLNCSMSDGITYCSVFLEDAIFGAVINFFQFRWTGSCIANPTYKPGDMLKAVLHALASSERSETPFLAVLVLLVWDDTPLNSASLICHRNFTTLIRTPTGHMRFVPTHL